MNEPIPGAIQFVVENLSPIGAQPRVDVRARRAEQRSIAVPNGRPRVPLLSVARAQLQHRDATEFVQSPAKGACVVHAQAPQSVDALGQLQ